MAYNWNYYNRPKKKNRNNRPDHQPGQRGEYEKNRKKILATQDICGICGGKVDKTLKYPHPFSATIDHIIPVSKGGHPTEIDNLQIAHFKCNRQKSDKIGMNNWSNQPEENHIGNRNLPHTFDWKKYRSK